MGCAMCDLLYFILFITARIAHTKNELKELRYQEEQTNNHLAMVLQPAEEAVRAQLTTVNTELESLQSTLEQMRAWEDKIRSGEEALTQLRAAEQSVSLLLSSDCLHWLYDPIHIHL